MIHDALDGTSGRTVWRLRLRGIPSVYVIAATGDAAIRWFQEQAPDADLSAMTAEDHGSADRTEIALWRDETRLPGATHTTTTDDERGAL